MMTIQQTPRQRLSSIRDMDAGDTMTTPLEIPEEFPQLVSVQRFGAGVQTRYSDNGLLWLGLGMGGSLMLTDPVRAGIPFANISGDDGYAHIAWVRARRIVSPEPVATLAPEE
jgi:hypothetical protein